MATAPLPAVLDETTTDQALAPLYKVLIHNDDKTPFDFVIGVLIQVFRLPPPRALEITVEAHHGGVALVVVEPRERAEFHLEQTHSIARGRSYPLTCTMEPA